MARKKTSAPPRRSPCPIAGALDVLGDRWTLLVIRDLFGGKKRYGEFAAAREKIPTNVLADRLERLEACGLVSRTPYQQNPPRFEYALTEKGEALRPVMQSLVEWGRKFIAGTKVMAEFTGNPADSVFLPAGVSLPRRAK